MNVPLAALRAAMEHLARDLVDDDPRSGTVIGALEEVNRMGRTVQELVEYSTPPRPMPLKCTVEEIVYSARQRLPHEQRGRIAIAREERGASLTVDGPLLAKCLSRLIENALEAGSGEVLLSVRRNETETVFATLNRDVRAEIDWDWALSAFRTNKPDHLGLGLTLVRRDVELMGGELELSHTPGGETSALVRVPNQPSPTDEEEPLP
ncbi:MAG: hypothetical protein O7B99_07015 [Planctomycetota bacterium]|nr:hypothetical protein [Planctomycetota bacterium]